MYSLTFNGRFELQNPDEFLEDLKELIKKHKIDYYGIINCNNLGEYVDFQRIEDESVETTKDE